MGPALSKRRIGVSAIRKEKVRAYDIFDSEERRGGKGARAPLFGGKGKRGVGARLSDIIIGGAQVYYSGRKKGTRIFLELGRRKGRGRSIYFAEWKDESNVNFKEGLGRCLALRYEKEGNSRRASISVTGRKKERECDLRFAAMARWEKRGRVVLVNFDCEKKKKGSAPAHFEYGRKGEGRERVMTPPSFPLREREEKKKEEEGKREDVTQVL